MRSQKQILYKLMSLGNKKADKQLTEFVNEIKRKIFSSSNNDTIYEYLELIDEFVYKVPNQMVDIFKHILKTNYPAKKSKSKFGIFEGKTRSEVILKGLELLSNIRYILPNAVLPLLEKVIVTEEKSIKEKALEILKKFSKYDYNVLFKSQIGYRAQRTALDYILKWSGKKCLANIDFVLTIVKELLGSSVEGSNWTDENTLTMHFAQLDPTVFLKKMRRDTMDFVASLYFKTNDQKIRLQLSSVLEEVMRGPTNIAYSDAIKKMMDDDARHLAVIYRKMIFDESGSVIKENIAIAEEVEERLYYFAKPETERTELERLRGDILKDPFYEMVYPIMGGRTAYKSEEGYEESKVLRANAIKDLISKITDLTITEWDKTLNILADQKNVIDEWKLGELKQFIENLSLEKSEIADKLLESAFKKDTNLIFFSENFLTGFQRAEKFDLWDKYVEIISKKKIVYLVAGIFSSLINYKENKIKRNLRLNEQAVLGEAVYKEKRFGFLKAKKKDEFGGYLHNSIFNALASNYKQHKTVVEKLLKEEIEGNQKYAYIYYNDLQFVATIKKWIDLSIASKSFKTYLLKKIIEAPSLDWHLQEFLLELCARDFECVMNVFKNRIDSYVKIQRNDKRRGIKRLIKRKEFEAIPYHFNDDLRKFIVENEKFPDIIGAWVKKMTLGLSYYNWEIGRFLDSIKADKKSVFSEIVSKGSDNDLLKVAYAIESIKKADFDLCMQIVGKTDNDRIHKKIGSIMYATGTVSGEFGIAEDYEKKIETLKKYLDSENNRINKFALEMTENLKKSAVDERKRATEESQLRKIKFEG